jgi:5-methylcytosine-specific restriction endonuclease McrA
MSDVLVLNSTYEPLNLTRLARAVRLVFAGKAEVVHDCGRLASPTLVIPLPSVIRMLYYIARARKRVALTKKNVLLRDDYRCAYCGVRGDARTMTVDHVIPRAWGGTSRWSNLVAACADCNGRKRDRTPEQAQMLLRRKPHEPRYIPFVVVRRNTERGEWGKYLGLYNISIEQRVEPA